MKKIFGILVLCLFPTFVHSQDCMNGQCTVSRSPVLTQQYRGSTVTYTEVESTLTMPRANLPRMPRAKIWTATLQASGPPLTVRGWVEVNGVNQPLTNRPAVRLGTTGPIRRLLGSILSGRCRG